MMKAPDNNSIFSEQAVINDEIQQKLQKSNVPKPTPANPNQSVSNSSPSF